MKKVIMLLSLTALIGSCTPINNIQNENVSIVALEQLRRG